MDIKAGDGVERRGSCGFARTEIESCVVPRTSDRVTHHEAFRKRSAIMGTHSACREEFIAAPDKDNGFAIEVAQQRFVLGEFIEFHSAAEIWSG
jgi:hypothetical protein